MTKFKIFFRHILRVVNLFYYNKLVRSVIGMCLGTILNTLLFYILEVGLLSVGNPSAVYAFSILTLPQLAWAGGTGGSQEP